MCGYTAQPLHSISNNGTDLLDDADLDIVDDELEIDHGEGQDDEVHRFL